MSSGEPNGGADWERNEAAHLLARALLADDAVAVATATSRLGDAVVNGVSSKLIVSVQTTFQEALRRELERHRAAQQELYVQQERRYSHILSEVQAHIGHTDTRLDLVYAVVADLPRELLALDRKIEAHNTAKDARLERLEQQQADLTRQIAAIAAQYDALMARLNQRADNDR